MHYKPRGKNPSELRQAAAAHLTRANGCRSIVL